MSESSNENMTHENLSYNTDYDRAPRKIINTASNEPIRLKPIGNLTEPKKPWGAITAVGGMILVAMGILGIPKSDADNKNNLPPPTHSNPLPTPEMNTPQIIKK